MWRHHPMGCGPDWIQGCIKRETESSTQHPLLSASWLKYHVTSGLMPLLPCPPGTMGSIPSPKPWAETDHSLKLFLLQIFFTVTRNQTAANKETAKADSMSKCCFYIHNNSPSISVFKKNLKKKTHKDWEYRSAVEHSKIGFVPTSSRQEIYTRNTCCSVKNRHNYLSILSKSIQHKRRTGTKGWEGNWRKESLPSTQKALDMVSTPQGKTSQNDSVC